MSQAGLYTFIIKRSCDNSREITRNLRIGNVRMNLTYMRRIISFFLCLLTVLFLLAGCGNRAQDQDEDAQTDEEGIDHGEEEIPANPLQPPDLPPEGMRYDEWKGFTYTKDMEFPLRTYWVLDVPSYKKGEIVQDDFIDDAVMKVTSAKAEPVGAEMKLRSGGYVDVTIEFRWTGTMIYTADDEDDTYCGMAWMDNPPLACDAYTGTSLLNMAGTDDYDSDALSPGQAVTSNMTESDIVRDGRTWRLFAKSENRNDSPAFEKREQVDGKCKASFGGDITTIMTFRVPADYDGLVIAIDKDISDEKKFAVNDEGKFLNVSDNYADILTNDFGKKQTADDYYFIKVSDILEAFDQSS